MGEEKVEISDYELHMTTQGRYGAWCAKVLHILRTKFLDEFETISQKTDLREYFIYHKGFAWGLYDQRASPMYAAKYIVNKHTGRKFLWY